VVYGINLYDGMRWGSGKWVGGPVNLQVFEDRSINIEMDVPMVRERVFFYISTSLEVPDGDPLKISPGYEIFASDLSVELVGDDVIFGPAVVLGYGESGLVEADGVVDGFTYSVELRDDIGRRVESVELTWIPLFDLQEQEVKEVRLHAAEAGFDPEKITGAWMGEIESLDEGTYQYSGTITNGEYYTYPGSGFSGTRKGSDGDRIIGEVEVTDGDGDDYEFPWALVVFFFLIVIVVFIISIIRYPSHNREPEPDEKLVRPGSPGGTDVKRAGNLRSLSRDGTRRP
jgi:hypothetical protein